MGLQLSQVAVVDTREQVVLNLQIKSACEEINEVIVGGDIMWSDNLVLEEVIRELFCCVWGKVVYLWADHEAHGE